MATRIVLGIVSAILASTVWILSTASDGYVKMWGAAAGVALAVTALCCYALVEIRSLRKQVAVADARTQAMTVALHRLLAREEGPADRRRDRGRTNSRQPAGRRPPRQPRPISPIDPGDLLSEEFEAYLQGRKSRDDDDPNPSY